MSRLHAVQPRLRPPSGEIRRDPRRDADDPAQPLVLPAPDAGSARCDWAAASLPLCSGLPVEIPPRMIGLRQLRQDGISRRPLRRRKVRHLLGLSVVAISLAASAGAA